MEPTRTGLIMALTYGSVSVQDCFRESLHKDGLANLSAKYFPSMVVSTIGGQVSQTFKLQGINNTVVSGITSGLNAVAHGYELLKSNASQDALVVVGADEIGPVYFNVFNDRHWTAESVDGDSTMELYGQNDGMVLGEGGGSVMLERADVARRRGAKPLARIAGFGSTSDGEQLRTIDSSGRWLAEAILRALADANCSASEIDWVLTHGRGVVQQDRHEIEALLQVFGNNCPPISCLTGNVGVGPASLGLFSVIAAVQGMQNGEAFPTVHLSKHTDQRIPFVRDEVRKGTMNNVLVIGSTENGSNTAIVLDLKVQS